MLARLAFAALLGAGCVARTELLGLSREACAGTGPAILLGPEGSALPSTELADEVGRHALCTCSTLTLPGELAFRPPPPGPGPRPPEGHGAPGVATDGDLIAGGPVMVPGTLAAGGVRGIRLAYGGHIGGDVISAGALTTQAPVIIEGAAWSMGDVSGRFRIRGALHVSEGAIVGPEVESAGVVREPVAVARPCGCAEGPLFDIAAAVAQRETSNDNASLPLAADELSDLRTTQTLEWSCGEYYLEELRTTEVDVEFRVSGRVAVFVAGDVRLGGDLTVTLEPGGELDLVVAGSLFAAGRVLGAAAVANRVRIWVGSRTVSLPDRIQLGATLYAPSGVVSAGTGLTTSGALFVDTLSVAGDLQLSGPPPGM